MANDGDTNEEDTTTKGDTTTTDGNATTTTDEEIVTEKDCDQICNTSIWLAASVEERKSCALSCKAGIKL